MKHRLCLIALLAISFLAGTSQAQMIVAHRGASFDAPENTLAAFNLAWELGADGVEGDFYVTKDQQIVCIHDKDTLRTAGAKLDVASSTVEELRKLEYGKWKGAKFAGEAIPTFAEVLKSIPADKKFIIELKSGPEIVPLLKAELEKHDADVSRMLIIAFNKDVVSECKKLLPDYRVHWLTGYRLNKESNTWSPSATEILATLKECKADGLGTQGNRNVVNEDFVNTLREGGMKEFHVWTINDPKDAVYFKSLTPVGITTDRPDLIRASVE